MKVKVIKPKAGAPAGLIANVELIGAMHPTIKIVDLAIWEGRDERGPWVAWPGRQFTDGTGKKKTARFVRAVGEEYEGLNKLNAYILSEVEKWRATAEAESEGDGGDGGDGGENPFA